MHPIHAFSPDELATSAVQARSAWGDDMGSSRTTHRRCGWTHALVWTIAGTVADGIVDLVSNAFEPFCWSPARDIWDLPTRRWWFLQSPPGLTTPPARLLSQVGIAGTNHVTS